MTDHPYTYRPSTPRPPSWMDAAACAEIGHQPFYPEGHSSSEVAAQYGQALAICRRCPVRVECLEHALATDERHGIWGGRTEAERAKMRRTRRAS